MSQIAARDDAVGWRALTVSGAVEGPGTIPLRPMAAGDLLDEPFILLRAHLRSILLFAAIAVVPSQVLQGYLARGTFGAAGFGDLVTDPDALSAALAADAGAGGITFVVGLLNTVLLLPLAVALVSRLAVSSVLGEHLEDGEVVRAVVGRLPSLAGTWLLALAAVAAVPAMGILLAVTGAPLPGGALVVLGMPVALIAFVLLAPAPTIAVVEGRGPVAALRRSVQLLRGRFWSALGVLLLALLVSGFVQLAIGILPTGFAFLLPEAQAWVLASAGSTLAGLLSTPYTMLVVVLLYVDASVRREALDLQLLIERAGGTAGAAG